MTPTRLQLRRTKGWRLPLDAKKVDRTTPWGNPFHTHGDGYPMDKALAVQAFARHLAQHGSYVTSHGVTTIGMIRAALRGKHLACWCPLPGEGEPDLCHAAVLLRIANEEAGI